MIVTKQNISQISVISFIYTFCQWLKCLIFRPLRLYGSLVRNWIVYCYVHDLNPVHFESMLVLLEYYPEIYLPEGLDIWVTNEEDEFKLNIQHFQNIARTLGYKTKTSKTYIQNNIYVKKIYCMSDIFPEHNLTLNVNGADAFLNVDFDVNNLYVQCSPEMGLDCMDMICASSEVKGQSGHTFGFFRTKHDLIHQTILGIIKKTARVLPLNSEHPINKIQFVRRTEKIMERGFQIENHPALKVKVENGLDITQCSICLESFTEHNHSCETKCSHVFHKGCLFKWWTEHFPMSWFLQCPNCRTLYNLAPSLNRD
jgi:hypothetical protein